MVKSIPEIIDKGTFGVDNRKRPYITYSGKKVGIMPEYDGKKMNWIVTAYEKYK